MTTDVLIVGCGKIAGGYDINRPSGEYALSHAGAYRKIPSVRISACLDPDVQARQQFALQWGIEQQFGSFDDIPADMNFPVVSICSPTFAHVESVLQCLRVKPQVIFLEKPLALSLSEAEKVIAACRQQQVSLVVNYSRRWDVALNGIISAVHRGEYGPLRKVVGHYTRGLLNNGSHMLDILWRLMGEMQVCYARVCGAGADENDPDIDAILVNEAGICVHLISTPATDYARFELQIQTADAEIRMLDGGFRWDIRHVQDHPQFAGYRKLGHAEPMAGQYWPVMELAIAQVIEMSGKSADYSSAMDALAVQRLYDKITGAAYENRI